MRVAGAPTSSPRGINRTYSGALSLRARVRVRSHEVQRNVRLVPHDPAIVAWPDVEDVSRAHLDYATVTHRCRRASRHDHPYVLDFAHRLPELSAHVHGPAPSRLVNCSADRHAAHTDDLESALLEGARLVGRLETFENNVEDMSTR